MDDEILGAADSTRSPAADPWAHRSVGMRCATCMWFVLKAAMKQPNVLVGRCRRHAPTMGGYPVVYADDWCGDHRLDENRATAP